MKLYLKNYEHLTTFDVDTVKVALLNGYTFDASDQYVVDVSTFELTDPTYSRATLTGKTRLVSTSTDAIVLSCNDISFGAINNETVDGVVCYKEITSDADSLLLAHWALEEVPLDGTGFDLVVPTMGLVVINA